MLDIKEKVQLYKGDCLEIMKDIPDKGVDMILCDLPYGKTRNKWDSIISLDKLWEQYNRIIKDNGAIALFAQTPFDKVLGASNLKMLKYEWIWEKEQGTGFLNAKKMPLKNHENILIFYKKPPIYNPQMGKGKPYTLERNTFTVNYGKQVDMVRTENTGERYPLTILKFKRDKEKLHPTQKPVALLEYLIKTYTNECEIVLDNCMENEATGVDYLNTNRRFIEIEKKDKYFEKACNRINKLI